MESVLTIFEVLSMPNRSNEWEKLSLVTVEVMQNNVFWVSY